MARGGKRPGAGRPKGTPNKRTREKRAEVDRIVSAAAVLPLEVMLETMRDLWSRGKRAEAAALAKDAAPYVHPRLSNVEARLEHDLTRLSDAELDGQLAALLSGGVVGAAEGEAETGGSPPVAH